MFNFNKKPGGIPEVLISQQILGVELTQLPNAYPDPLVTPPASPRPQSPTSPDLYTGPFRQSGVYENSPLLDLDQRSSQTLGALSPRGVCAMPQPLASSSQMLHQEVTPSVVVLPSRSSSEEVTQQSVERVPTDGNNSIINARKVRNRRFAQESRRKHKKALIYLNKYFGGVSYSEFKRPKAVPGLSEEDQAKFKSNVSRLKGLYALQFGIKLINKNDEYKVVLSGLQEETPRSNLYSSAHWIVAFVEAILEKEGEGGFVNLRPPVLAGSVGGPSRQQANLNETAADKVGAKRTRTPDIDSVSAPIPAPDSVSLANTPNSQPQPDDLENTRDSGAEPPLKRNQYEGKEPVFGRAEAKRISSALARSQVLVAPRPVTKVRIGGVGNYEIDAITPRFEFSGVPLSRGFTPGAHSDIPEITPNLSAERTSAGSQPEVNQPVVNKISEEAVSSRQKNIPSSKNFREKNALGLAYANKYFDAVDLNGFQPEKVEEGATFKEKKAVYERNRNGQKLFKLNRAFDYINANEGRRDILNCVRRCSGSNGGGFGVAHWIIKFVDFVKENNIPGILKGVPDNSAQPSVSDHRPPSGS